MMDAFGPGYRDELYELAGGNEWFVWKFVPDQYVKGCC